MTDIAIILPAFNEAKTIKETILDFYNELPHAHIVVIDNNSQDNTSIIAQEVFSQYNINGTLLHEKRQGKGNAIRYAFRVIEADIYVMADADMTYPATQVHQLIDAVEHKHADMVIGDRHSHGVYEKQNKRPFHNFGNHLVKTMVNKLFSANISDIMSGYRAFSRRFVKNYPILVEGFELETDMTLHALDKRFAIIEIPISYKDRPQGSISKLDTFTDGQKVIRTIIRIFRHYHPLVFFSFLAILFALLSLISAIPVFNDWFTHQYIYHVPLAILATGLGLISIILFSLGITLDSISHQHKVDYEQKVIKE